MSWLIVAPCLRRTTGCAQVAGGYASVDEAPAAGRPVAGWVGA
jgi:hypothetical protein